MSALTAVAKRSAFGPSATLLGAGGATAGAILGSGGEKEKGMFVPDGFHAVRTRFGRAVFRKGVPIVKTPGFHPTIPGSHANKFVSIQDRVCGLGQVAIKREQLLTVVHAEATWGIKDTPRDVHAAWLRVKAGELDQRFAAICGNAFNIVMSTVPVDQVEDVSKKISWNGDDRRELDELIDRKRQFVLDIQKMTSRVAEDELSGIGAEIRGLSIRSDAPHPFNILGANAIAAAVAAVGESESDREIPNVTLVPAAGA